MAVKTGDTIVVFFTARVLRVGNSGVNDREYVLANNMWIAPEWYRVVPEPKIEGEE